jgi:phenylalanyl-tRNA synthetase beta chain
LKVSLNWLKSLVDLKDIPAEEIIHNLTMSGLEVEEVSDETKKYKGFVVGYVKEKQKHTKADKLSVCTVFDGKNDLQVICGAPNVEAGQKVVFAPEGTIIPKGNFKIGKAKIRGIESFGMICSEDELELSNDHSGIIVLPEDMEAGTPLTEAMGFNDIILEVAITPNRPDALSHIGVARDLSAIYSRPLNVPSVNIKESDKKCEDFAAVEIEDEVNCPRYSAKVILDTKVEESPEWLKERISKIGLRPINNIVDITNFIMYETGQPLHAFDLDLLAGSKIIVKSTKEKSKFTTLDSKERELKENTLLICDAEKPVAIAGIMGGENSEISSSTRNILIESAYFHPSGIRRSSKYLGLSTDASYRFERGTDPGNTVYAAERAAEMIQQISGGEVLKGVLDTYPSEIKKKEVSLRYARVKKVLGYDIDKEKMKNILIALGMDIIKESDEEVYAGIALNRPDIEREIDLIEEIARINGYDNIPTVKKITITLGEKTDESSFAAKVRETASGLGFFEMINNPLQSEKLALMTGEPVKLLNPLSSDMAYLRTSLIPGALAVVQKNIYGGEKNLELFEIGNVFNKKTSGEIKSFEDFEEKTKLLFLITGKLSEKTWIGEEKSVDFYSLKGAINSFLSKISLDNALNDFYYQDENRIFDITFSKKSGSAEPGYGGRVKNSILKEFDIDQDVFCFEFDLDILKNLKVPDKKYQEPLRYPKIIRDFAFIFPKEVNFGEVKKEIKKTSSGLLKSVEIFDIFESQSLGENKKSMAFTLEFFDNSRTLTEDEVEIEFNKLISTVVTKFNAKLRGT